MRLKGASLTLMATSGLGGMPSKVRTLSALGMIGTSCLSPVAGAVRAHLFIVPNLCLWPGSLIVVDPKGENATLTANRRGQGSEHCVGMGQAVHVLDPMNVARVEDIYRASFNPLDALDPNSAHVIDDATRIADALVEIGEGESRQWDEGARALVRTLLLHVVTHPHYQGRRNLVTVRRLILQGEKELADEIRERRAQSGESGSPSGQVVLWELARKNDALNGVIAASADSFLESAKNSPRQYNSYRIIAERCTEFLDSPGMASCVSSSSFCLADLKTDAEGVSIYLSLPQQFMSTHYRWLRMMIALTITEMETVAGQPASGAPVLMVLDEFAGLRRMDIIENGVAQIAGFGVKMFFVLQSLEQLKSAYPDRWETFFANCGVRIFFAITDNFTNQYVSDALGEQEVIRTTRSRSQGSSVTDSRSETISESQSEQFSTSETRSKTAGSSYGGSRGFSSGRNRGYSQGSGTSSSESESFSPEWFFSERTGRQRGTNQNSNTGSSHGTSWGSNKGRNWSSNKSNTRSSTTTQGGGTSTSQSYQTGSSRSRNLSEGESEQILKKPLVTKDEIAKLFNRIDDQSHPAFPGLILVSIAGEAPLLLRRTFYHQDHAFIGLFDPHPDHPFIPVPLKPELSEQAKAPQELPKRTFNPSHPLPAQAVTNLEAYKTITKNNPVIAQTIKASVTINHPIDLVWYAITSADYYKHWFMIERSEGPMPDEFYPGYDFNSGYVLDAGNGRRLNIFYKSDRNYEFSFIIERQGSNFTELSIEQIVRTANFSRVLLWLLGGGKASKYIEDIPQQNLLKKQLVQFRNMCDDLAESGRPADDYWHDWRSGWCFNRGTSGIFRTKNAALAHLGVGDYIDVSRHKNDVCVVGHIEYKNAKDGATVFSDCWVGTSGTIISILKEDGDFVEQSERILRVDPS